MGMSCTCCNVQVFSIDASASTHDPPSRTPCTRLYFVAVPQVGDQGGKPVATKTELTHNKHREVQLNVDTNSMAMCRVHHTAHVPAVLVVGFLHVID
jgi:hypothetical protein